MTDDLPAAPTGFSGRATAVWDRVVGDYDLDAGQLALLEEACRSLIRADEARAIVDTEGLTYWVLTTLRKARTALQGDNVVPTHTVLSPADAEALDLLIDMDDRPLFQIDGPWTQSRDAFGEPRSWSRRPLRPARH